MKISIVGDAYALTSKIKVEDIELLRKHSPVSLKVKDKDNNDVFAISYKEGSPSISAYGITFGGKTRDNNGFATITGTIPAGIANAKEFIADTIGSAVSMLKQMEENIPTIANTIRNERKSLMDSIEG